MCIRSVSIFLAIFVIVAVASPPVDAHIVRKYRHWGPVERDVAPASFHGGRLVYHPANNIACMTRDRATRALPCDQPVWVYGEPCEIDLGLGRSRPCD